MQTTTSSDGTTIAYEHNGSGEPVVLVVGAFNERVAGAPLAGWLAEHFTTVIYDRRGRGDSGDTPPYAPEREVEDLAAIIGAVGGRAAVFGYSSGATLAMLGAVAGLPITRLALYESPTPAAGRGPQFWHRLAEDIDRAISAGDRGGAVELFQTRAVGIPEQVVAQLRKAPFRPALERIAHTLSYEAQILATDPTLPTRVDTPSLVLVGAESPAVMLDASQAVATMLTAGDIRVLAGQGHDIDPESVGPSLLDFYCDSRVASGR